MSKEECWEYYQDLLKQNGFDGITDLLSKYHELQKMVDEANAQPVFGHVIKEKGSVCEFVTTNNVTVGCHTVYARPIPVQQSPAAEWIKNHAKHPDTCDQVTSRYRKQCSCGLVEILECKQSPAVAVPENAALIPMLNGKPEITNRMKAECMGNFTITIEHSCSSCAYHGEQEDCEVCGGEINYSQNHQVPWDTCKSIYKAMATVAIIPAAQSPNITDPTELELHRADYRAIKSAGFESPSELLAAYNHLLSNRVTEQDARDIIDNYIGFCDGKRLKPQSSVVIGMYVKK